MNGYEIEATHRVPTNDQDWYDQNFFHRFILFTDDEMIEKFHIWDEYDEPKEMLIALAKELPNSMWDTTITVRLHYDGTIKEVGTIYRVHYRSGRNEYTVEISS